MNKYKIIRQLGDGSFGTVMEGENQDTRERVTGNNKVAIKKMKKKYYSWNECLNLREVKVFLILKSRSRRSTTIPTLFDSKKLYVRTTNFILFLNLRMEICIRKSEIRIIFLFRCRKSRNSRMIVLISFEMLQGLAYMHKHGFFHRDMKPENLLVVKGVIKIADFGLARETRSLPPYTEYVSTRWYRAPEVLLRSTNYSSPIDMWAIGTIIAEIITLQPLFPGSTEIDQIYKIAAICGPPLQDSGDSSEVSTPRSRQGYYEDTMQQIDRYSLYAGGIWPEGLKLASQMNFKFQNTSPVPIANVLSTSPDEVIQLVADMLKYDPHKRPTASETLRHSWFADMGLGSHSKHTVIEDNFSSVELKSKAQKFDTHQPFFDPSDSIQRDTALPVMTIPHLPKVPAVASRTSVEESFTSPSQRQSFVEFQKDSQSNMYKSAPYKYPEPLPYKKSNGLSKNVVLPNVAVK
jgi:serine/threonine protein kinase